MSPIKVRNSYRILHVTGWALLCGVFLFEGAPLVGRAVSENKVGPVAPNQSIDLYLQGLTGIKNGAQELSSVFKRLPPQKPVVIFVREQVGQSGFLGMLIAYVAWPRPVQIVDVPRETAEQEVAAIKPSSVAGLIFCFVNPPPWLGTGVRLGSGLLLVPVPTIETQP